MALWPALGIKAVARRTRNRWRTKDRLANFKTADTDASDASGASAVIRESLRRPPHPSMPSARRSGTHMATTLFDWRYTNLDVPPWARGRHGQLAAVQTIAAECCASAPHSRKKASSSAEVFNRMAIVTQKDDNEWPDFTCVASCHFMSLHVTSCQFCLQCSRLMHLHGHCCKLSVLFRSCMVQVVAHRCQIITS